MANAGKQFIAKLRPDHPDPIHVTTVYYGIAKHAPVQIKVKVVKSGKSSSILRAKMVQEGRKVLASDMFFGNLEKEQGVELSEEIRLRLALPVMPFRRDREPSTTDITIKRFAKYMTWWYDHDAQQRAMETDSPVSIGWSEFHDKRPLDVFSIL